MLTQVAQRSAAVALGWLDEGRDVAVALLCAVEGSTPLDPGRLMFVTEDGRVEGSITGGCVEGAVVHEALDVLQQRSGPRLRRYGIADDLAGTAGLTCGGTVHVLVQRATDDAALAHYLRAVTAGRPAALGTILDGAGAGGRVAFDGVAVASGLPDLPLLRANVDVDARAVRAGGVPALRRYGADGARLAADVRVQFAAHAAPRRMVIVGAIDFTAALIPAAAALGYDITVVDPRTAFLSSPRFAGARPDARWPDVAIADQRLTARDAVLVFTHDAKLDVPALLAALASGAGYIGVLGSRRTTAQRDARLRAAGVDDRALERLHAPCGLDLGAATPEETAVAVLAEIIATRASRPAVSLRETAGAIRGG